MKNISIYQKELEDWKRNTEFYKKEISSPFFLELMKAKIDCYGINIFRDKVVVDVGGGNGFFLNYLKQSVNFCPITIDFSFDMLMSGQTFFKDKTHYFINASADCIPLKKNSVDILIFNGALHHFKASGLLKQAIEEGHKVLKENGYICIYDRNGSFVSNIFHSLALLLKKVLENFIGKFSSSSSDTEPNFNDGDLKILLNKGYHIQKRMYVSSLPFFLLLISCNFIEYAAGNKLAQFMRKVLIPLGKISERILTFKFFTIEQCLLLSKVGCE